MIDAITRGRRGPERAFTLIELLVVIAVLAILSGVVVFAMRGSGDKGKANAVATDERIVRTAMETFCARYGRYAEDMDELVNGPRDGAEGRLGKGFLSNASTYNETIVSVPPGENNCGGTGYRLGDPLMCSRLSDQGQLETVEADSGMWCLADPPGGTPQAYRNRQGMVRLLDGKVLAVYGETASSNKDLPHVWRFEGRSGLFDPTAGPKGQWTEGPRTLPVNNIYEVNSMTLIEGTPEQCAPRCGHVLANIGDRYRPDPNRWQVYDPTPQPSGAWTATGPDLFPGGGQMPTAIQLKGTKSQCGIHCGHVIVAWEYGEIEFYDPKSNSFLLGPNHGASGTPNLTLMEDGRVLLITPKMGSKPAAARIMDASKPPNAMFSDAAAPKGGFGWPGVRLLDRRILFIGTEHLGYGKYSFTTEIYTPGVDGGFWTSQPSCGSTEAPYCHVLARLADGRVLASSSNSPDRNAGDDAGPTATFLFDPDKSEWERTGMPNGPAPRGLGVLIAAEPGEASDAKCRPNCDRVLAAGTHTAAGGGHAPATAELFTP